MSKEKMITAEDMIARLGLNDKKKNSFLYCVILRLKLSIELWMLHKWFSLKYPVSTTEPVEWIENYNHYLKDCTELRKRIASI